MTDLVICNQPWSDKSRDVPPKWPWITKPCFCNRLLGHEGPHWFTRASDFARLAEWSDE